MVKTGWIRIYKYDDRIVPGAVVYPTRLEAEPNNASERSNVIDIIQIAWNAPDKVVETYSIMDRSVYLSNGRTVYTGFASMKEAQEFLVGLTSAHARTHYYVAKTTHTPC